MPEQERSPVAVPMVSRRDVVVIARSWIGTPYHHQASRRGVGADCLGLVRGIFRAIHGREAEQVPGYSADWGEASGRETLLEAAHRHLLVRATSDAENTEAGDVVVFRMRRGAVAKHVGVMTSNSTMVHAAERIGVVEVGFGLAWRRRAAGIFSFPGIVD